jgi:hypothetical protein
MMRKELLIAAFGLISAVAVAGWIRKPEPAPLVPPDQVVQSIEPRTAPIARPASVPQRTYAAPQPVTQTPRRQRSTGRSVAIVAGSAGTGAAVGAIAGGKKGAGIGAISGGAAGFVYDQMTRNR